MNHLANKIKNLPDRPGIYLFYNQKKELVYVGKATSLKNRVKSYFLETKNYRPIEAMISFVTDIKWQETDSVLEALILEANYIKKFYPKYNVKEKDDKSWNYLVITNEDFPKLQSIREHDLINFKKQERKKFKYFFGPYAQIKIKEVLKILHSLFNISRCSSNQKRPCFDYQLGHCLGVCINGINKKEYQEKIIAPLVSFLQGDKKGVLKILEKKMKQASENQNFEEAGRIRNQIFSLKKIKDFFLLDKSFLQANSLSFKKEKIKRIEGYDISNFGNEAKVGSMVVFNSREPLKNEYKKFKIKNVVGQSDVDCLKEVIERRLKHSEWPWPEVFLIDGGKPQVNAVFRLIKKNNFSAFVVGIAKGKERKKNEFIFSDKNLEFLQWVRKNENLLIRVRNEAHRFAIAFQRSLIRKR
jgi:excinuclease ABC subunit C